MVRLSQSRIDYLMEEDVPYIDLTSTVLGISEEQGEMQYFTREACTVAGAEIVARMAENAGCQASVMHPTGSAAQPGETIVTVTGSVGALHQVWKAGLNVLDHLSAVATKTRAMVDSVHKANPHCEVLTTRKSMPGCKDLLIEAIMAGGAFPHRLGLSETVLVFEHHMTFLGGFDAFVEHLPDFRSRCIEKKLFVEATPEQALTLARAGVDGIQLDKVPASTLKTLAPELRAIDPRLTLIAAGGINPANAADYASTGVDGLATTCLYTAKPLDMSVRMTTLS